MAVVYLSLGSNVGDRRQYLHKAIGLLNARGIAVVKSSAIIETLPVGGPAQDKYLNVVLKVKTLLTPEHLHELTQSIEHGLGRVRKIKNGPRVIDIDILLYDDVKLITKKLIIPHPRMFERDFVMKPLKEIDPALCASLKV